MKKGIEIGVTTYGMSESGFYNATPRTTRGSGVMKIKVGVMLFKIVLERWSVTQNPEKTRVKSGKFGHQVNSDTRLQTVEIQMRRLLMSRLIRIFTVCEKLLYFFIPKVKK